MLPPERSGGADRRCQQSGNSTTCAVQSFRVASHQIFVS